MSSRKAARKMELIGITFSYIGHNQIERRADAWR